MSTDSNDPAVPAYDPAAPAAGTDVIQDGAEPAGDRGPGWLERHTALFVSLLVAVIVVAVAIAGLVLYRDKQDDRNTDTEAAFTKSVAAQGAKVETVECTGDTCAAVIGGQAYTVLVQEDGDGDQHFGVSPYTGG